MENLKESVDLEKVSDILDGVLTHNLDKRSDDSVSIKLTIGEVLWLKELLRREIRKG